MHDFYIELKESSNKKRNIHRIGCIFAKNREAKHKYFGKFISSKEAVNFAYKQYDNDEIGLCYFCSKDLFN